MADSPGDKRKPLARVSNAAKESIFFLHRYSPPPALRRTCFLASLGCYVLGILMPMIVIHPVLSLYDEEESIVWSSLQLTFDLIQSGYNFPATLLIVSTFVVPCAKFIGGAFVVFSETEHALLCRVLQALASYQLLDVMVACIVLALCAQGSVQADPGRG